MEGPWKSWPEHKREGAERFTTTARKRQTDDMKFILSSIASLVKGGQERNVRFVMKFMAVLIVLITFYSVAFHFVMLAENKNFSWITGLYWTLTVMTTLGFGDITFASDLGKVFSIIVLLTGVVALLTMLPFILIQFLYLPWLEFQKKAGTPRRVEEGMEKHVILTSFDPVAVNLIRRLKPHDDPYVIILPETQKALELHDQGYKVIAGDLGDSTTYRRANADKAALVLANAGDMMNTSIAFTVREVSADVVIAANADLDESVDIIELAGSTYVFQFMKMLGESLARRVLGISTGANVIGNIDSLLIAEAPAMRTPLEGKTLAECRLRELTGITVVGLWDRGRFSLPTAETVVHPSSVLLLAGSAQQLEHYDEYFGYSQANHASVLILGGGRVGCAAANLLRERNIDYRIVEKDPDLIQDDRYVQGSAADLKTLERAGIKDAASVIVTTGDDIANIYLAIYCRRLRPDVQIISRATFETNVSKLHRAGADLVMSYAAMAAGIIRNILRPGDLLMPAEGLTVFRVAMDPSLIGKTLGTSGIAKKTGCSVIAVYDNGGMVVSPDPSFRFDRKNELILIGTTEAEKRFFEVFSSLKKVPA